MSDGAVKEEPTITTPEDESVSPVKSGTPSFNDQVTVIEAGRGIARLRLNEIWRARDLIYFLTLRDVKVRYKQTALGLFWAILQPVVTMIVFSVIFGKIASVDSEGIPYPIFVYAALLPWAYFSQAIIRSGGSLVGSANLIRKVYFPRLVVPLAASLGPLVDFFFALFVLLALMIYYSYLPSIAVLAVPAFLLFAVVAANAFGLWFAAINVRYRDVRQGLPFIVQMWLFSSPIVYPLSQVPEKWQAIYSLNPMVLVAEGFRWGLLDGPAPPMQAVWLGIAMTVVVGILGLYLFRYTERTFADVI